ncbi:ABC transporter substrate-binding protein [Candidatus Bipolaricaulota bacterium]|nr:ABC transporter substrate-binding protein [Candidatus Bipolaricaulota bacterium]
MFKPKNNFFLAVLAIVSLLLVVSSVGLFATEDNPLVLGDLPWNSAQVQNRIVGLIAENAYDVPVEYQYGGAASLFLGVKEGDVDVLMETWSPNRRDLLKEHYSNGWAIDLGDAFPNSPQGWYVPSYVIEGDEEKGIEPMAPDLESVKDLAKYKDLFKDPTNPSKGRFYSCPSTNMCFETNGKKLEAYGLADDYVNFDPGSWSAQNAEILSAVKKGEPILFYNWEPTWLMGLIDATLLKEPSYTPEKWENHNCAYPPAKVHIEVAPSTFEEFPEIVSLLTNYRVSLQQMNNTLSYIRENDADFDEAAAWFLKNYPNTWRQWFPLGGSYTEEKVEKVNEGLEKFDLSE